MLHQYYDIIDACFVAVSIVILASSVDDFFIDACYWGRTAYRWLFVRRRYRPLEIRTLRQNPEKRIAVMIPAWDEADVIAKMIETSIRFIEYDRYTFFVGVYPNDRESLSEVDRMVAEHASVKKVLLPHDGPTCKADCLNRIIRTIFTYEACAGVEFDAFVMHDSEDIIHPLELKMFNHLVSRKDLIQIPVRGLEGRWCDLVRGTYVDEFAEHHGKEMLVKEALTGVVPSAGVASCFSRRAILLLGEEGADVFNTATLTEDYDISYRLARHGLKQVFVKFPVDISHAPLKTGGAPGRRAKKIPIAVSEYFPNRFWAAVRQKARWVIGIDFQGFGRSAWRGGFFNKYFFIHDRKGVVTSTIMPAAYFLLLNVLALRLGERWAGLPPYVPAIPAWLVYANAFFLANRALQRMYFTWRMYDAGEALLSFPRIFVGNAINFCAMARAIWLYGAHLLTGRRIVWDKTAHEYPPVEILERRYRKLGEILLEKSLIDEAALRRSLDEQQRGGQTLGRILLDRGLIREDDLLAAISAQTGYPLGDAERVDIEAASKLLPRELMREHGICPVSAEGDRLDVLTTKAIADEAMEALRREGYRTVNPALVSDGKMGELLWRIQLHEETRSA